MLAVLTVVLTGIRVRPLALPATDARAIAGARVGSSAAAAYPLSVAWLQDHPSPPVDVKGLSAILVDVHTHEVLWERDADSVRAPASLTKLVTAMVVADHVRSLDQLVKVAPGADVQAIQQIEPDSTVMGIHSGEVWTVRDLLTGLFLLSGNDAAEALAQGIGMPRDSFIQLMNEKAQAIGMRNSHFTSPVGLDAPSMYSSADDLAVAGYTIDTKYPQLVAISDQPQMSLPATATHQAVSGVNWLHSFFQGYAGATGMKTGFTDNAGGCTVATATRGDRRLIAVVMHSDNFVIDAEHLLDYGFSVNPS
ncbi:MAG: D-alanyl-D-alanine carboxypeptidase [Candidatus Dormibacteraeota bacterium]|nr:D-alanyl-D-alanine carboxypeptidase [Candidatus Dormibacteraeota bacterium]